jgi:hypothetical protein
LLTNDLRNPLTDAINNGKTLGIQNKQRGAVVLRKAIDKLQSDLEKVRCVFSYLTLLSYIGHRPCYY